VQKYCLKNEVQCIKTESGYQCINTKQTSVVLLPKSEVETKVQFCVKKRKQPPDEVQCPKIEAEIEHLTRESKFQQRRDSIKLTLFAHDTSILVTGKDIQDLTYNLDEINKSIVPWFDKNRLIINKGKSLTLGFHHKLNKHIVFPDVIVNDRHITYETETKFVGVWLDHNFGWDFHVENLIIKVSKLCFALKTTKAFVSKNVLRTMYFAYFHSLLRYGILFWGNSRNLKKVFKLQKRAIS
jgi:hypothetical protein